MRVIVAGAGIGGLAAATLLARAGVRCVVLERAGDLGEVGAGVQVSPNAARVLASLGLLDRLAGAACRAERAEVISRRGGAPLFVSRLGAWAETRWGAPYLQLHRSDLHAALAEAAAREPGVEIRLGAEVAAAADGADEAFATLLTGERVGGDLLIGADGLRSRVRDLLAGADAPRFTGWTAWRALVDPPSGHDGSAVRVWIGPGRHLVAYPVRGGARINLVAVVESPRPVREGWSEQGNAESLRAAFRGWPPQVLALLERVERPGLWGLYDRPPLASAAAGRVALLGDAAHPMAPFLAQGAAMALEDAAVLARAIGEDGPSPPALRRYAAARGERTRRVAALSRRNGRLYHLPLGAGEALFALVGAAARLTGVGPGLDWLYGYDALAAPL